MNRLLGSNRRRNTSEQTNRCPRHFGVEIFSTWTEGRAFVSISIFINTIRKFTEFSWATFFFADNSKQENILKKKFYYWLFFKMDPLLTFPRF